MRYFKACIAVLVLVCTVARSQPYTLDAHLLTAELHLDGRLAEADWAKADVASSFWMNYPFDTLSAVSQTEVRMLISETHLYIGAICHHQTGNHQYVVQSLKRDFTFRENEAFSVIIDAYNDATSGYGFTVNPYGAQSDGLIANGGNRGETKSWDGLWLAEVSRQPGYWSVEMAIPLKTLRYTARSGHWGINFARNDLFRNEISTWVPVARGFEVTTLANKGRLTLAYQPKSGSNAVFIPYAAGFVRKDYPDSTTAGPFVGADAKIALNSSLYLDLTARPDFSQVEVDQQVIDLSRFELFFPEQRLFFLENSDLFASLGNRRVHPFFSRRIGGADEEPVTIHFGARISGKLNKDWRMGLMTIHTALPDSAINMTGNNNFSLAALQRTIFSGSTLTGFVANRQRFLDFSPMADFNRVAGLEFDYRSKDARWVGKGFVHRAFAETALDDAFSYSMKARYKIKTFSVRAALDVVGENYLTDMGYVPRLYHEVEQSGQSTRVHYKQWRWNSYYRIFFEKNTLIDYIGPDVDLEFFTGREGDLQEYQANVDLIVRFMDGSALTLGHDHRDQKLLFPFSLPGLDRPFPVGRYPRRLYEVAFDTGKRKGLYYNFRVGGGRQYMGKTFQVESELNYRWKHYATLGLTFSQKNLYEFPEVYGEAHFILLGSKIDLSFSRNLFFTTYLQYNTQTNNININSRFQWRFQPLSDIYLVYTENYFSEDFAVKNRALVVKISYWWGI